MQWRITCVYKQGTRRLQSLPRRLREILTVAVVLGMSLAPRQAAAQLFREIVVIGDSLSDIGNVLAATRPVRSQPIPVSPPYFMGRFSNGQVWVEMVAAGFGLQLAPSLNFAYGGAEIGFDTSDLLEHDIGVAIPSLRTQVQDFLLSQFFDDIDPVTLYVVWGGANDVRDALMTAANPFTEARAAVDDLAKAIRDLVDADALYFLVPNLPDLGHTPESRALSPEAIARATNVSIAFNNALTMALDAIEAEHNVVIARLDTFARLKEVVANPAAFGFTNVTDACLAGDFFAGGTPCTAPGEHLFWDQIHPTAAAHALLAQFASATLPPLVATRGNNSPEETAQVTLPAQDLPVLQVRLGTGAKPVRLTHVMIDFDKPMQQAALVSTRRVQLINDANANGRFDTGEVVLATAQGQGPVTTLPLDLTPPFDVPPSATVHLIVTLDINSPTQAVAMRKATFLPLRQVHGSQLAWLSVLLPIFGLIGAPWLQGLSRRISRITGILIVCCGIMLTSCDSIEDIVHNGEENNNAFTVTIPAQGMTAQDAMSGALTVPPVPITGATVRLKP